LVINNFVLVSFRRASLKVVPQPLTTRTSRLRAREISGIRNPKASPLSIENQKVRFFDIGLCRICSGLLSGWKV